MATGKDITEEIPYVLSNPSGNTGYSKNAEDYDVAIAGNPFFLMTNDETPYSRETAPYRKQQVDQSNEPGEQSITGWWVRAQSSFHSGAGINYYDPSAGETVAYRFANSKGVDIWSKGKVTLLNDVMVGHNTTGTVNTNGRVKQHMRSIDWGGAVTASINNKALTSNVATLTTVLTHGFAVGMDVTISGVDATFNGTYTVTSVPTSTTFTYAKVATNVTSTAVSPIGTAISNTSTYSGALFHDEYDADKVFPNITASVSNKALTSNVATLTTSTAHGMSVGMEVVVTGVDATFNGTYIITSVPSTTTFTYAKTATNVTSTAVSPVGTVTSNTIHFIDYNAGTDSPVYAICDDGTYAYWVTNTATKKTVYKKPLNGNSLSTADVIKMFDEVGAVTNATMDYVKDRIVMCLDNKVYEFATSATAMPTVLYTHPTTTHLYTSVAASGPAIYIAGYNGIQSTIQRFALSSSGSMPTLTSAIVSAEMPVGEVIHVIKYYLGYILIGTNKGVRIAVVSSTDGSLTYGPLIVETSQPCYDFAMKDKYVWCATSVDGAPGTIRIDLSNEIETLVFAWANDIYYASVSNHKTTACAFMNNSSQLAFATAYANSESGYVYVEELTKLLSEGYVTTGKIRYGTLENKIFKTLKVIADDAFGGFKVESIDKSGNIYTIGNFNETDFMPEMNISYPIGAQEYVSFRFTIRRMTTDNTKGCVLTGFQLKGIPSIPRQRLIRLPLACFDIEKDSFGNTVGQDGAAFTKVKTLEAIEDAGDTIRVEDFRTGESYLAIIEQLQFINRTPSDKRFSGYGGILVAVVRTI